MTHVYLLTTGIILCAYLLGSLSSAIIICKLMGLPDPRLQGSGNPGTTNVLRIGGKVAAILTLCADILKGMLPVIVVSHYSLPVNLDLVPLAAFLGHIYPIFFRLRGGKGVATALGGVLGLAWPAGLAVALTWLLIATIFRYSSLAALISALTMPIYLYYATGGHYIWVSCLMSLLLIYRHHSNIQRLWSGTENKLFLATDQ